jgi:hypothetical protein
VKLEHFEVKRHKNYRIRGSKTLTSPKYVFTLVSVKDHSKLSANRNFVVKLEHFGVKRRKNYRIRDSKAPTFLSISFYARKREGSQQTKRESEFRCET